MVDVTDSRCQSVWQNVGVQNRVIVIKLEGGRYPQGGDGMKEWIGVKSVEGIRAAMKCDWSNVGRCEG